MSATDTGFYYLQSRYYDPAIGRFINADVYTSTGQGLLGCNMFAYCRNNPVSRIDISGTDDTICLDADNNPATKEEDCCQASTGSPLTSTVGQGGGGNGGLPVGQNNGGNLIGGVSPKFTPDQQAVIRLAKDSMRGGLTVEDAEILVGWAREYGISCHEPMMHPERNGYWSHTMHIKIMNMHIKIK